MTRRAPRLRGGARTLWAAAFLGVFTSAARAEQPAEQRDRRPRAGALFPSRQERLAQLERDLAQDLEATLAAGPRVVRARVHLSLPTPAGLLETIPARPGKAVVLIQHEGPEATWSEQEVRDLVAGGVQGLAPDQVRVFFRQAGSTAARVDGGPPGRSDRAGAAGTEEGWTTVGPIVVQQRSAELLRLVLGALSVAGLLLVGVVVALWWRLRPLLRNSSDAP